MVGVGDPISLGAQGFGPGKTAVYRHIWHKVEGGAFTRAGGVDSLRHPDFIAASSPQLKHLAVW